MQIIIILVYAILVLLIAYFGRNRKFGFWGFLFLSLFLTPIVGFISYLSSCEKINIVVTNKEMK